MWVSGSGHVVLGVACACECHDTCRVACVNVSCDVPCAAHPNA